MATETQSRHSLRLDHPLGQWPTPKFLLPHASPFSTRPPMVWVFSPRIIIALLLQEGPSHVHSTNGTKDDPNGLIAGHIPQKLKVRLQPTPDGPGPKPDLISPPNDTQKGFVLTSKFASRPIARFQLASIPSGLQEIPHTNPSVTAFPHKNGAWPSLRLGPLGGSCRPLELCPSLVGGSRWVPDHIMERHRLSITTRPRSGRGPSGCPCRLAIPK